MRASQFALLLTSLLAAGCGGERGPTAPTPPPAPVSTPAPTTPGRHAVSIAAGDINIGGVLYLPAAGGPRPAVIVLHGWQPAGTNGAGVVEARAARLADEGFAALALSLRGWPPSGGADDCGLRQPDDVVAAAAWLRGVPAVAGDRIALLGFSQGGQVALLAAARDNRLRGVAAYFPVTDVARWKTTTANSDIPGYITSTCEPGGTDARSPVTRASAIGAAVLLVHGDADTRVPAEQSRLMLAALTAAGRAATLELIPGAQHGFTAAEEAQARPLVDRFLASLLN